MYIDRNVECILVDLEKVLEWTSRIVCAVLWCESTSSVVSILQLENNLNEIDTIIEQPWLEVKEKKKKPTMLLGTVYQSSPEMDSIIKWLYKIEIVLLIITSTFLGTIILPGDTNINRTSTFKNNI